MSQVIKIRQEVALIANNGRKLLVGYHRDLVAVVSIDIRINDEINFIPYSTRTSTDKESKDKFYKLVGKLAQKDISSKYFDKPILDEHLVNGGIPTDRKDEVLQLCKGMLKDYEVYLKYSKIRVV